MEKTDRIFIAGASTLIGNAIRHELDRQAYRNIVTESDATLDLTRHDDVDDFFKAACPDYVFCVAGKSGGIAANMKHPAEFLLDNVLSTVHVLECARRHNVKKLFYLASACCYPRNCPQPMKPEYLLQGPLEPTNEAYAIAKITGIKLCQAYHQQYGAPFIVGIPSNPYGPGDSFDPEDSHVIAALMRAMHEAKISGRAEVTLWGTGTPRRDFIYIEDLAKACVFVMDRYNDPLPINLGRNDDVSIAELANTIRSVIGFNGKVVFDRDHPDGMPVKCLNTSPLLKMGWKPGVPLDEGLCQTYQWYLIHAAGKSSVEEKNCRHE